MHPFFNSALSHDEYLRQSAIWEDSMKTKLSLISDSTSPTLNTGRAYLNSDNQELCPVGEDPNRG